LEGCLSGLGYTPTIEEMNQAVLDAVAENYLKGLKSVPEGAGHEAA
jgi:hypothetical protein